MAARDDVQILKPAFIAAFPDPLHQLFSGRKIEFRHGSYRIGTNGSLAIRPDGCFYCHKTGSGGDVVDLVAYALAGGFKDALAWIKAYVGGSARPVKARPIPDIQKMEDAAKRKQQASARHIWSLSKPVDDSGTHLVRRYLAQRGLTPYPWPEDIHFKASAYNFTMGKHHPVMVCAVRNLAGDVMAVHQTFLTPEARKIEGEGIKAKLFTGSVKGSAIRLAGATDRVALAEGIETALSVTKLTDWPCWATGSASNIPDLPETIKEVLLAADSGKAGEVWAKKAATRYAREGRIGRALFPPEGFGDFNDVLMKEAAHV